MNRSLTVVTAFSVALTCAAAAKSTTPVHVPLPRNNPLKNTEQEKPAMALFSEKKLPSLGKAMAIGYYPRGCLQGGVELPTTGQTWQVMRLSRSRNWGHPDLVKFLERFAPLAAKATGWKRILIGDMAQPRGGPLPFGHKSHQIGLDVDIWLMPMPDRVLSQEERENISASDVVAADGKHVDDKIWSLADRVEGKNDRSWMSKVRPWYGHADHIHVRLKCPADSPDCRAQPAVPEGDGCDKSLDHWFADWILRLKIPEFGGSSRGLKLKDLPPACAAVLNAPASPASAATEERSEPR